MYTLCAAKSSPQKQAESKPSIELKEYPELVACYNEKTGKFAKPADKTNK